MTIDDLNSFEEDLHFPQIPAVDFLIHVCQQIGRLISYSAHLGRTDKNSVDFAHYYHPILSVLIAKSLQANA